MLEILESVFVCDIPKHRYRKHLWHTAEYMANMRIILQQINTQENMGMCHKK